MYHMKGLDVSVHNGVIDYQKVVNNEGYEFVIIRAGYGKNPNTDTRFEENYAQAKKSGLHVGAYWYSYAANASDAVKEANAFIQTISGDKQFDMPVYYDLEEDCTKQNAVEIAKAFCDVLESHGYYVGIYASKSYIETYFDDYVRNKYSMWVAQWGVACTYEGQYGLWQCTDSRKVSGINGNVDEDICRINYPEIITGKGFNGYFGTDYSDKIEDSASDQSDAIDYNHEIMCRYNDGTIRRYYAKSESESELIAWWNSVVNDCRVILAVMYEVDENGCLKNLKCAYNKYFEGGNFV